MPRAHATTVSLILLAAVLAVLGAVVWIFWVGNEPLHTPEKPPVEIAAIDAPQPSAPEVPTSERTAVPEEEGDLPSAPVFGLRGRVVDAAGTSLADVGVAIVVEAGEPSIAGRSDAAGSFLLSATSLPCFVVVDDPKWTTLRMGEVREDAPLVPALVVAVPAVVVRGVVVDRSDRPLARAQIGIRLEKDAETTLPDDPNQGFRGEWNAESGADGAFVFERAPAIARARISTRLAEFKTDERALDLPPSAPLRIVLDAEPPEGPVLEGTVVQTDGTPVPGAVVSLGSAHTRSDVHGRFRLVCGWFGPATPLVAAAQRSSPAVLAGYGSRIDPNATKLPPEQIVLPGKELSIAGRVLLASGAPAKGWRVYLADPTPVDPGGPSRGVVESQKGNRIPVRADARGAFEIAGLCDRSYRLLAAGRDRSSRAELAVQSEPLPAGSRDVVLLAPDGHAGHTISGRIVSEQGTPVGGARIGLGHSGVRGGATSYGIRGAGVLSNSAGRFEIHDVPAALAFLVVQGQSILPARVAIEAGTPRADLTVRVRERRELTFVGSAGSPVPDLLGVMADGKPATIWASTTSATPQPVELLRLENGISGPLAVGSDVQELVLYRGCRELGRVPLVLSEEPTRVVWP